MYLIVIYFVLRKCSVILKLLISISHFFVFNYEKVLLIYSSYFLSSQISQLISLRYCSSSETSHYIPFSFEFFKCTEKSRIRWGYRPILSYTFQSRPSATIMIIYQICTCDSNTPAQLMKWNISMRIGWIRILTFIMEVSNRKTSKTMDKHLDLPW